MKFVARGKDCASERGHEKQDRYSHLPASSTAQCTPEQHCQDRVFRQVSEFSDSELNRVEHRERDLRIKPSQKRHQKPGRMLGREHIGGTEED